MGGVTTAYDCCGYLRVVGPPFSSRLDGQSSIAWRFLGPSINLDFELTKRLRCGAAPGPWTPAQLEKLGPAVGSEVSRAFNDTETARTSIITGSLVTAM